MLDDLRACIGELADTDHVALDAAISELADALLARVVADDFYIQGIRARDPEVADRGAEHEQRAREQVTLATRRILAIGAAHGEDVFERIDLARWRQLGPPLGDPA